MDPLELGGLAAFLLRLISYASFPELTFNLLKVVLVLL